MIYKNQKSNEPQASDLLLQSFLKKLNQLSPRQRVTQSESIVHFPQLLKNTPRDNEDKEANFVLINKKQLIDFTKFFAEQKNQCQQKIAILEDALKRSQQNPQFSSNSNQILILKAKYQEEIKFLKEKLMQETSLRQQADRKFRMIQYGQINSLKNQISMLQSKLRYQEEQTTRYQQYVTIKEQIIRNLEWEKSISQSIVIQKPINKNLSDETSNQKKHKQQTSKESNNKMKLNETLDLSQIGLNLSEIKAKNSHLKMLQSNNNDSIGKKFTAQQINKNQTQNPKDIAIIGSADSSKNKSKSITIRKSSTSIKQIKQLENVIKGKDTQIQTLKLNLLEKDKQLDDLNQQLNMFERQIKDKQQYNNKFQNREFQRKHPTFEQKEKCQRKIVLYRQKCQILESQLESMIQRHIDLEQSKEKLIKEMNFQLNKQATNKQSQKQSTSQIKQQIITPQFKDTKFKAQFFPKAKDENIHNSSTPNRIKKNNSFKQDQEYENSQKSNNQIQNSRNYRPTIKESSEDDQSIAGEDTF